MSARGLPARRWPRAAFLAAAATLSAAGCATEGEPRATASARASQAAQPQTDQTLTEQAQQSPRPTRQATLPAGYGWTRVPGHDLQFAAPQPWNRLDPATLQGVPTTDLPPEVSELAAQLGQSPEQFIATLSRNTLLLVASPDSAANITVAAVPGDVVPAAAEIRAALEGAGATPSSTHETSTPVGPAIRVAYGVELDVDPDPGLDRLVSGQQVIVDTGDAALQFTVTARAPDRAAEIAENLLGALRRAG